MSRDCPPEIQRASSSSLRDCNDCNNCNNLLVGQICTVSVLDRRSDRKTLARGASSAAFTTVKSCHHSCIPQAHLPPCVVTFSLNIQQREILRSNTDTGHCLKPPPVYEVANCHRHWNTCPGNAVSSLLSIRTVMPANRMYVRQPVTEITAHRICESRAPGPVTMHPEPHSIPHPSFHLRNCFGCS